MANARTVAPRERRWARWLPVLLLVVLPFLVKAPLWTGVLVDDPVAEYADIQHGWTHGLTAGLPTIDRNIGYTSHALGSYAAREWMRGRVPWWNPFEGVGAPLAGEMQSAAFFPLTPLLLLPHGQLLLHTLLQIIAGLGTYALLRRLGITATAAAAGALLFEFNSVFAWLANAVVNPICFLPWILLGVELARGEIRRERRWGLASIALAVALSLVAGFPETAVLDGLLAALWVLVRAFERGASAGSLLVPVGLAVASGVLLTAPLLIAFLNYLPQAELGVHGGVAAAGLHLDPRLAPLLALPYWSGGIFTPPVANFWGIVGGCTGLVLPSLGVAALFGRRERRMRWALGGWIAVSLAITYGVQPFTAVVGHVPGLSAIALCRYLPASWLMALCILAAFALDDMARSADLRPVRTGVIGVAAALLVALLLAHGLIGWRPMNAFGLIATALQIVLFAGFAAVASVRLDLASRAQALACVAILETLLVFVVPVLAHRRRIDVEAGGVAFLQQHLGLQRFATLKPIAPNYGTYFEIAAINHDDLPAPASWTRYIRVSLDTKSIPILFVAVSEPGEILSHLDAYRSVGVRYVTTAPAARLGNLPLVYRDDVMSIFELDRPRPYVTAPGCRLAVTDRETLQSDCTRPATLTRLELFMPGWRAWVSGTPTQVSPAGPIFQSIALPAGRSDVRFAFTPPKLGLGLGVAAGGAVLLAALLAWPGRRKRTNAPGTRFVEQG